MWAVPSCTPKPWPNYQVDKGHDVAVFYPSTAKPRQAKDWPETRDGVRLYGFAVGERSRRQVFQSTFHQPKLNEAFADVLEEEDPDIVHIQHLMGLPASIGTLLFEAGRPYVITLHDYWYGCANAQLVTNTDNTICAGPQSSYRNCAQCALARARLGRQTWLAPAIAPLMASRNRQLRLVLLRAKIVIAPTKFVRRTYKEMGLSTDNFKYLAHGIDVPQETIKAALATQAEQPQASGFHVGFIGSLGQLKGVHVLIEAFNGLPDDARLTLYGGLDTYPDYVAELREMATHPGITFAGRVDRADLWAAIAAMDVVVLPTLWYEASPLTIQEVFAVKVPLVASNIGAMSEKIRDKVDGRLFPPGDAHALQQILLELQQQPAQLARLQAKIQPVTTMSQQVQAIMKVYKKALSK